MAARIDRVTIPRSEIRPLESTIVDQTYQFYIALPPGYDEADKRYPVVYASPAFPGFFFLWPIISSMLVSEELPPLILAGIGYGLDEPREIVLRRYILGSPRTAPCWSWKGPTMRYTMNCRRVSFSPSVGSSRTIRFRSSVPTTALSIMFRRCRRRSRHTIAQGLR